LSYGGRGITVCDEWREDFSRFLLDVGRRPSSRHQLDRYPDNNGNYEPSNVRWALPREQARNTRQNIFITYEGETLCVTDWAERLNVSKFTLYSRFRTTGTIFKSLSNKERKVYGTDPCPGRC
jgi:AraC-like DNA-binding protein